MRRIFPLLGLLLTIGACGDDSADPTSTSAPTTTVATSTTIATTTIVPPTTEPTATTVPVATTEPFTEGPYVLEDPGLFPPPVLSQSEGPSGSGCIPGSNTVIPDGIWYGYVLATTGTAVTFDMACWFWGDIAYVEGAKDGVEVNNDYYVRNQNPLTFQVPIGPGAAMWFLSYYLSESGTFEPFPMSMADWPGPDEEWPCPGEDCGVWLYINDGVITEAIEQYRP
jgi:hypothetical protein